MLLHQKKNHYLRVGLVMTALITLLAVVGAFWTPYEPTAIAGGAKFAAPSLGHLFGTDNFGRDIFSRVMCGVGTTFFIALGTILLGAGVARSSTVSPTGTVSTCSRLTSVNHALPVFSAP